MGSEPVLQAASGACWCHWLRTSTALKLQVRKVSGLKPQLICSYMQILERLPIVRRRLRLPQQLSDLAAVSSRKDGERLQRGLSRSVPPTGKYCFSLEVAV